MTESGAMRAAVCAALLLVVAGCRRAPATDPAHEHAAPVGRTGTASITGVVRLRGAPPAPPRSLAASFPECAHFTAGLPADPGLVVSGSGGVRDALVWIRDGLPDGDYPVPQTPVVLDQRHCEFSPRVFGIRPGQPLLVRNSDPLLHNVHSAAAFNLALPHAGTESVEHFRRPGVPTPILCDVHAWMRAYAAVVRHPFFAVTDAGGGFALQGLPAGTYTVELWQERLGWARQRVTVGEGETRALAFELK